MAEVLYAGHIVKEMKILFRRRYLAVMKFFLALRGIFEAFNFAEKTLIMCKKKKDLVHQSLNFR
jgi:hypothetical protein